LSLFPALLFVFEFLDGVGHDAAHGDFDAAVFAAAFDPVVKFEGKRDIERFVVHVKFNADNHFIAESDFNTKNKKVF
jgi:hypothetical protein